MKGILTRSVSLLMLFLLLGPLTVNAGLPEKKLYFRHLKTEQGLSNGQVNTMLKDRNGLLWIGTYNGLNCFDGSHFKTWKAEPLQEGKLQSNSIHDLCEDREGAIWCATDVCISRYSKKNNQFENFKLIRSRTGAAEYATMFNLLACRNGMIVTHSMDGLYVFDPGQNRFVHYAETSTSDTLIFSQVFQNSLLEDPFRNGVWMGTNYGMRYFDLDKRIFYNAENNPDQLPLFDDHFICALTLDHQNRMIYEDHDNDEIVTYDLKSHRLTRQSTASWQEERVFIAKIFMDRHDNKWISTWGRRLFFMEAGTGKISEFGNKPEDNYSIAAGLFMDAFDEDDGTVYLGTTNGISYTNPDQNFFSINLLPDSIIHRKQYMQEMLLNGDFQGGVWMAPSYRYAIRHDPATGAFKSYDFFPETRAYKDTKIRISAMTPTPGRLYFGTTDGIWVFDVKREVFERLPDIPDSEGLKGRFILKMIISKKGELWFTSHHNGLFRYSVQSRSYRHYRYNENDSAGFSGNYIYDLHEDRDGTIWIMAENDGLIRFDEQNEKFEYYLRKKDSGLPDYKYVTMEHDAGNNLWFTNYVTGLTRYNPATHTLKLLSASNGLSNLAYHHMIRDRKNQLWLSYYYQYSILGLDNLMAENIEIDFARNSTDYVNHFCLLPDGRIASETRNGYILFQPDCRMPTGKMEPVLISGFTSGEFNLPFLPEQTHVSLSPKQNFFSFDFSSLSCLKNPHIRFSYMLEGFDKDWISSGDRRTVYYTNVGGGSYTFRVRALDAGGSWVECRQPVRLEVASVFYATIWFRLLLLFVLAGLVYWYFSLWKRKEWKEKSEEAIAYFAGSITGGNKVDEILWDITQNVIARTNFLDCVVYLLDEQDGLLHQKAAYGNKSKSGQKILNPIALPLGRGIVGTVAQTGQAEIVKDTRLDSRYIADDSMRLSELAVPILYEGRVIGVIDSEHPERNFFKQKHLELMKTIASISGTKIMNALKEQEINENEKRLSDLQAQIEHTRQQALRAQMNPHFIFNCLNSINGFILQNDATTASAFLIKFSKLIRLILEHSNEKLISLQSELEALKLYIEMEKLRFDKKFIYEIITDEHVMPESVCVPPLIFQPFVENAIWHGLLHKETAGDLRVHISRQSDRLQCIIEDNGIGRLQAASFRSKSTAHKKSLGLELTRERLALLNKRSMATSSVEVVDLINDSGEASGTRVVIHIGLAG